MSELLAFDPANAAFILETTQVRLEALIILIRTYTQAPGKFLRFEQLSRIAGKKLENVLFKGFDEGASSLIKRYEGQ